jgi:phage shock protein A
MSLFKRLSATLSAQVDQLVGEIENHDAVVEAGIRDARRAYATAKVRLERLKHDGERLRERLDARRTDADTWRRRAAGSDHETRGLECLRRAKRAAAEADALAETLSRHDATCRRLDADVDGLRRQVETLEHRRRLMRSRAASADAAARLADLDGAPALNLDDTFERWEIRIAEREVSAVHIDDANDSFAAAFDADEERAALQAELALLKAEQNPEQNPERNPEENDHAR